MLALWGSGIFPSSIGPFCGSPIGRSHGAPICSRSPRRDSIHWIIYLTKLQSFIAPIDTRWSRWYMPRTRRLSSIDFNANLAPTEEFLGSDIDLFLQRLVRLTFSDFKGWLLWFVWDRLAMKPCQRYLRLVGGQTACGGWALCRLPFWPGQQCWRLFHWGERPAAPHYTELPAELSPASVGVWANFLRKLVLDVPVCV